MKWGTRAWDCAQSSLPCSPQPVLAGGQAGASDRTGDTLSPGRLLTASVLTAGCSRGQRPSQRPNRIHIHERPLSLSNGLGTASPAECDRCIFRIPPGCWAKVALCKQGLLLRDLMWPARHCPLGTLQNGTSMGSWQGAGVMTDAARPGAGQCGVPKATAGWGRGARSRSWYWRWRLQGHLPVGICILHQPS